MRTARAAPLCLSGRGTHGLLQLHRRLLRSYPAALRPGVSLAHLLRTGDANRPTVRHPLNRPPNRGNFRLDRREIGGATAVGYFRARSLTEGGYVAWVLRLVEIGAEGGGACADGGAVSRPDGLVDRPDVGLTLAEAKLVLAGGQREIVAAQARGHAIRRPGCRRCEGVCRVKDYRQHAIATLFGQVAVGCPASAVLAAARPGQAW